MVMTACGSNHGIIPPAPMLSPVVAKVVGNPRVIEKTLYAFEGSPNGRFPSALVDVGGTLYGATQLGGSGICELEGMRVAGCGTIFKIDESSAGYAVLRTFPQSGIGGAFPAGSLIYSDGALYGTTGYGGGKGCVTSAGCGTVFRMRTSGKAFRILRRFGGGTAGEDVQGIVPGGGTFYGAAFNGGDPKCKCGLIFKLMPSGMETVLHEFTNGTDGENPSYPPVIVGKTLYGTTPYGGSATCSYSGDSRCGTLYTMSLSGKHFAAVYQFKGGTDGTTPNNVIAVNGWLYGTTTRGGGSGCGGAGCGTVFKISVSGKGYTILHRFKGGTDGQAPGAIDAVGDTLYSVTSGGSATCSSSSESGCGTIFTVGTSGSGYTVLYHFTGGKDGARPSGAPIVSSGVLYGETDNGGDLNCNYPFGCGTIYSLAP